MNEPLNGTISSEAASGELDAGSSRASAQAGPGFRPAAAPRRRGADYYDTILWRVYPKRSTVEQGFTLGVTSADRQAGVSTVAANLAIRAADHRQTPVLLVDANFSHPIQARHFRLEASPGLTDVLTHQYEPAEAIRQTSVDGLSVMPLGSPGLVDRTTCDFETVAALVNELRSNFALVVFDLPSIKELRHALLVSQQLDSTLLAVRANATRRKTARATVDRLNADGVQVMGAVITQHKRHTPSWLRN